MCSLVMNLPSHMTLKLIKESPVVIHVYSIYTVPVI